MPGEEPAAHALPRALPPHLRDAAIEDWFDERVRPLVSFGDAGGTWGTVADGLGDGALATIEERMRRADGAPPRTALTILAGWRAGYLAWVLAVAPLRDGVLVRPRALRVLRHPDGWCGDARLVAGEVVVVAGHPWSSRAGVATVADRAALEAEAVAEIARGDAGHRRPRSSRSARCSTRSAPRSERQFAERPTDTRPPSPAAATYARLEAATPRVCSAGGWRAGIHRTTGCAPSGRHGSDSAISREEHSMAEPTLKRGSEGQDVKDLQEALIALDFKPGEADGVFGVFTESAVKAFQKWAGAMADGIVGPETWAKLDDADRSDPTLRNGSEGVAVRGLQRRLIAAGLDIDAIDGRFGSQTEAAVRAFQERSELDVDGIAGPQTWKRLNALAQDG